MSNRLLLPVLVRSSYVFRKIEFIKRIAILGGGPSGMFLFKRLIESGDRNISITIFERKEQLGMGMPYSREGANDEHITNVSANEIPELVTPISEWIKTVPRDVLSKYCIDADRFNEYKVLPRLLFGQYLAAQFELLQQKARDINLKVEVLFNSEVTDLIDQPKTNTVSVEINGETLYTFDKAVVCTGHNWPVRHEGKIAGCFDSPYPPAKLKLKLNHPVAIKGSSLTAVDAIRTLSRQNGSFTRNKDGGCTYQLADDSPDFRLVLHTRSGVLPAVRFHLDDSHLHNASLLSAEEIAAHKQANDGFLSLDYIFEQDFKLPLREKKPEFYDQIKDMSMEEFVASMMELRERLDPFQLLKAEYAEAEKSIKRQESVYWKEMLGVLSFALNYPAKYLSAEDMLRLQKTLMPLISIVIAYVPQSSSEELMALHQAGVLDLIAVGEQSEVEVVEEGGIIYHYTNDNGDEESVRFQTYVDCVGQPHFSYEAFPFKSMLRNKTISPAKVKFRSAAAGRLAFADGKDVTEDHHGDCYLKVSGIAINDYFQVIDEYGAFNDRIYVMAVPYIGGYNPDYSGLDFSEAASAAILKQILL